MGEWAGAPMPLPDLELIIEPTWPAAKLFHSLGKKEPDGPPPGYVETDDDPLVTMQGGFWSTRLRQYVMIMQRTSGGKRFPMYSKFARRAHMDLNTIGASYAWGIEQERAALDLLGTLVRHHTFKQYLLVGMFIETSKRSGVSYIFRKLKPTIAMRPDGRGFMRVLCTLCLHPIAYYGDSWAGAMCPTDDVVAHLMLMRGDEHMFWKRANQHQPDNPGSGL